MERIKLNEYGEIVGEKNNDIVVKVKRNSACEHCGACSTSDCPDEMVLTVSNPLHGQVGDRVVLELDSKQVLKASAIAYLIPLFALILGIVLGYIFGSKHGFNPEMCASVLGLLFTALSFLAIRALEPQFQKGHQFSPKVVQIIKTDNKGEDKDGK